MKRFFLVDLENVGKWAVMPKNKETMKNMTGDDVIVAFSNRAHSNGKVPVEFLEVVASLGTAYRLVEIDSDGKNALDFCMASMLGMLISENGESAEYWIVSNDRGFEACREFAGSYGAKVGLTSSIYIVGAGDAKTISEREMLKRLLPEYSGKAIRLTQQCLSAAKNLSDYHNRLQKVLYESQIRDVYGRTRHLVGGTAVSA